MPFFTLIPISCSGSAPLRPGHQRHGHLGAAPVEGTQRQRRHRGLLRLLLRARQTRVEHRQQQARRQRQVPGSILRQTADTNIFSAYCVCFQKSHRAYIWLFYLPPFQIHRPRTGDREGVCVQGEVCEPSRKQQLLGSVRAHPRQVGHS